MYIIIYSVLLFITFIIGRLNFHSALNPLFVWGTLWSFIGLMANLAFFDYYPPSDYVNSVIVVGIIVYTICCLLFSVYKRSALQTSLTTQDLIDNINYETFWMINIGAIIFEFPFMIKALRILMSHGFQLVYLRGVLTDAEEGIVSGGFVSILRDSGVKNVFTLTALYAAVLLFSGEINSQKKKIIVLAVIETLEYCITNAARVYVVNFVFFVVFALLLFKKDSIIAVILNNKQLLGIGATLLVIALFLQNSRASDMSIIETIYMYYCSGPSYLTQLIKDSYSPIRIGEDFYYGTITFGFIANIFYYLKIGLLGINDSTVKLIASTITIKQYFVGKRTYLNAMCTCFYAFLADWGWIGSIIGPIICAFLTCRYYISMKLRKDIGSVVICIYIFYLMIRTVFKWEFLYIDFSVILAVNYLICPIEGQRFVLRRDRLDLSRNVQSENTQNLR